MSEDTDALAIIRKLQEEERRQVIDRIMLQDYVRSLQENDRDILECESHEISRRVFEKLMRGEEGVRAACTLLNNLNKLITKGTPIPHPKTKNYMAERDRDRISTRGDVLNTLEEHWSKWNGRVPEAKEIEAYLLPPLEGEADRSPTIKRTLERVAELINGSRQ